MSEYIDSIDRELARRAGGGLPFSFVVYGGHPSSMVDVEAATKAIIADADNRAAGTGDRIYITNAIYEAVVKALRAAHPRRDIVVRTIEESGARHVPVPEAAEGAGPSSVAARIDDEAVSRAAERIARLNAVARYRRH